MRKSVPGAVLLIAASFVVLPLIQSAEAQEQKQQEESVGSVFRNRKGLLRFARAVLAAKNSGLIDTEQANKAWILASRLGEQGDEVLRELARNFGESVNLDISALVAGLNQQYNLQKLNGTIQTNTDAHSCRYAAEGYFWGCAAYGVSDCQEAADGFYCTCMNGYYYGGGFCYLY